MNMLINLNFHGEFKLNIEIIQNKRIQIFKCFRAFNKVYCPHDSFYI